MPFERETNDKNMVRTSCCAVCFQGQFSETRLLDSISIKTCLNCGFRVSDITPGANIDRGYARVNDNAYHQSISKVRRHQALEILSFVNEYRSPGGAWFDIGCGCGLLLFETKRSGYKIFGIEPDEKAAGYARTSVGDEYVVSGVMTNDTIPDSSVDIISMLDVLEHLPAANLSDFAEMVHRKLRTGGLWVIKVPSTDGLYFTLAHRLAKGPRAIMSGIIKRLWQSEYEFPHTVYFSQQTLRRYLDNHGFTVIASRYLADVPNDTVIDRLLIDSTIPRWQAFLIAPAFYLINFVESWRGKSDALLMLARKS